MNPLALARPELLAFTGYRSARREAGLAPVLLNANESPVARPGLAGLNRYPEPQPAALREALARHYGVARERLLLCRGSDEAIDLLVRAFCRPGRDAVLVCPPTFGFYAVAATIQGAAVIEVPLRGERLEPDLAAIASALDGGAVRLLFLCSPNNPTGQLLPEAAVAEALAIAAGRALVVLDEAYVEFSGAPSWAHRLPEHPHLAVLRTLSKAHALAGARVGALLADPRVVELLARLIAPYPLPRPSIEAALAALADPDWLAARVAVTVRERERLAARLRALPAVSRVLPSAANFLAFAVGRAEEVARGLAARGVLLRELRGQPGLSGFLRVSVGTAEENDAFLAALEAVLAELPP
ncbi:MAG: histidinol-phosphate transaminase [Xanthomonadales bacterium]|nr:histidinol-phosphate transaminase [Xanthomonadales bacterium]